MSASLPSKFFNNFAVLPADDVDAASCLAKPAARKVIDFRGNRLGCTHGGDGIVDAAVGRYDNSAFAVFTHNLAIAINDAIIREDLTGIWLHNPAVLKHNAAPPMDSITVAYTVNLYIYSYVGFLNYQTTLITPY